VITFLQACLYVFAGCAALGILPAAVLAAMSRPETGKVRSLAALALALAVAGFAVFVLVSAAGDLR
jgi:hypothetical protein